MKTEIVSFYADVDGRTYYSDHAIRLMENCKRLNIPHDIRKLKSRGEYRLNCLIKPKFILAVMEEKKKPFVWMDVDSIIHQELTAYDELEDKCDVAFAYQAIPPNVPIQLPKASPIYLNYTPIAIEFIKFWVDKCEENEKTSGQKVFDHEILMRQVLPEYLPKLRIGVFGINYAIWPGTKVPPGMVPMITMGIADGTSKEKSLREMGLSEHNVKFNLVGNRNE
jgi:hypothetical protein